MSWRTLVKKRQEDLDFLARLRVASLDEATEMLRNHATAPEWKVAAIKHAIRRLLSGKQLSETGN